MSILPEQPSHLVDALLNAESLQIPAEVDYLTAAPGNLSSADSGAKDESFRLTFTWSGKQYQVELRGTDRVYDLRSAVQRETAVPTERQKYIGLVKGKLPGDEVPVSELDISFQTSKFVLVGTPEDKTFKDPHQLNLSQFPDLSDHFDVAYHGRQSETAVSPAEDPRNIKLVSQKLTDCPINIMNSPRPGKKLLVLDLDYTLVDSKPLLAGSLPPLECLRPSLHEFLEKAYINYDIVIWSQTNYWWLESKLYECGIIGDESKKHKLLCVCDRKSMFPIFGQKNGQVYKHEVKPLSFLWQQPQFQQQWSAKNTIHIDDLSRNFALNPREGLKIRAYHGAGTEEGDDHLIRLSRYLDILAECDDFTQFDHGQWKKSLPPR